MKNLASFKRLIILAMASVNVLYEWLWYRYFWYGELFPRWVKERLPFWENGHILVLAIYAVLLFMCASMYGGMKLSYYRNTEVIFSMIFATLFTNVLTYAQVSLMCLKLLPVRMFCIMTVVQIIGVAIWTVVAHWILGKIFAPRKLLLLHGNRPIEDILRKFASRKDKYMISKCMNIQDEDPAIREKVEREILGNYGGVVLWDIGAEERNYFLKYCFGKGIRVYTMPKITDVILKGSEQLHLFDTPILLNREYSLTIEQRFFKRLIDLVCAVILFVVSSPIMLITAVVVKLYDGGPVLYKQVRCTQNQKEFNILKFRSMRVDAEKDGVARLASKGDSRITPIGRFIRKVRIDELPQLINIIKGEMSFIGPRPERPEIIEKYLEVMPEFAFRTKVKAGLAGYAQVYGKYNTTPYDKLKLDLFYIENYSVWLDIKLMLLTLKILFTPDSTEGVDMAQITAMKNEQDAERRNQDVGM